MSGEVEAVSAEQAADLAALQSQVVAAPAPGQPVAEPEPPRADLAGEIKALTLTFVQMVGPVLPCLPAIYTEETTAEAAQAVAAICEPRGWLSDGLMGEHAGDIAAGFVLLPLAIATFQGVRGDLARMKKSKPQEIAAPAAPQEAAAPVVGSREVVIGAPIAGGD